ncbi:MAG: cation-translocating P-type ATPase, partial [Candidatus Aenigmatarchaeota archaeon]
TVEKKTERIGEDRPLAERNNMGYMNTHVTRGDGKGVVVATGTDTEAGAIAEASKEEEQENPFVQEVSDTGKAISKLALGLIAVASLVFMLYGKSLYQIFMLAAALIIGSIPAALPVTVTYSLTNAAKKMASHNALIKNLPMIETLGGVDAICTDKTGTLTKNEMAVKKFHIAGESTLEAEDIDRERHEEIIRCALTANEAQEAKGEEGYIGSPEDVGLLEFLESNGYNASKMREKHKEVDFLPFSSERKMAQSLVEFDERKVRYTKGAPEVIIDRCDRIWVDGEIEEFTEDRKEEVKSAVEQFSEEALRNLAFSYKDVKEEGVGTDTAGDVFLGVVGMWDPPKEGVKEAIHTCYDAGIEVKMITGDSRKTAEAIAEECGMEDISTVTWEEVKDASDEEMEEIVQENNVFARMDPELKMDMVDALHRLDKQVAITGDGVNDTPPMEAAEVGVAMGDRGSDITRDTSDIILLDDNFASIEEAVRYGRTALSNVRKVTNYLLTANLFEVVVITISSFLGFTPFLALQLLWVNFATDIFPAIGLGGDPPHPDIMEKLPTGKKEKILTKRVWYMLAGIGLKKVAIMFGAFFAVLWFSSGSFTALGITGNLAMAQTSCFVWLGLAHIDRIAAIRWDEGWKGKDIFINDMVNYSLLWPIASFLIILYTPLAEFFQAVPLPLWTWALLAGPFLALGIGTAILVSKGVNKILGGYGKREY